MKPSFTADVKPIRFHRLKHSIYVIKSYLKLEPCGYCGKANDPNVICYKCMPK